MGESSPANAVKEQIHHAQSRHAGDEFGAGQGFMPQRLFLGFVQFVVMAHIVISGQQESASATSRIVHRLAGRGPHHVHDGLDESTRSEILSRPSFHVRSVFLQQALVGIAFNIHFQSHPLFFANQIGDKALQLGGVLNFVLSLAKDYAEHSRLFTKLSQDVAVMTLQSVSVQTLQADPIQILWNTSRARLYGGFVCSSAIFKKRRNVNCST